MPFLAIPRQLLTTSSYFCDRLGRSNDHHLLQKAEIQAQNRLGYERSGADEQRKPR